MRGDASSEIENLLHSAKQMMKKKAAQTILMKIYNNYEPLFDLTNFTEHLQRETGNLLACQIHFDQHFSPHQNRRVD